MIHRLPSSIVTGSSFSWLATSSTAIVPATDSADSIRQKLERLYGQVALYQMPGGHYIVDLPHEEANAR